MMWIKNLFKKELKPFVSAFLPSKDGHSIFYSQYGNPEGTPVLFFHGGPGGSAKTKYAELFDTKKYRLIMFDQRGCGNSQFKDLLDANTTADTLSDAKRLLKTLNITQKIIVYGCSWGSTLALLFAESNPEKVKKIIVTSVFLARKYDTEWINSDSERFYPDLWATMRKIAKQQEIYPAFRKMLYSNRKKENNTALAYLGSYEYMLGQLQPEFLPVTDEDGAQLQSARVYFHYEKNNFFLKENQILRNIAKIHKIPTLITHNRLDFCCPLKQAWDLHTLLPRSEMVIVPDYGHVSAKLMDETKKHINSFL